MAKWLFRTGRRRRWRIPPVLLLPASVMLVFMVAFVVLVDSASVARGGNGSPKKGPCTLIANKEKSTRGKKAGIPLEVNGQLFRYKERSVIVVCKNMSASDIEKLVPNISKACQFNTGDGKDAVSKRKHCMELTKKNVLSSSKAVAATATSRNRNPETQNNRELKCRSGDFACMLKSKVKDYLKRAKIGGKSKKTSAAAAAGAELLLRGNRNPPAKAKVKSVRAANAF